MLACAQRQARRRLLRHPATELLDRHRWESRRQLAQAIFEWIEVVYNQQRRHSTLGMLSPLSYAHTHRAAPAA
jgi:putative transposase